MTEADDRRDLHALIDRLEPGQVEELRRHALRLVRPTSRFRVLRSFDGPGTDLSARAKEIARAEMGEDDRAAALAWLQANADDVLDFEFLAERERSGD